MTTLETFIAKFTETAHGTEWHPTMRKGNTGVGYTLETLLGIEENNLSHGDWRSYELKSGRIGGSNPLTLFTKTPKLHPDYVTKTTRPTANKEILNAFGYEREHGFAVHASLRHGSQTRIPGENEISLGFSSEGNLEITGNGQPVAFWKPDVLAQVLNRKYGGGDAIYVSVESRYHPQSQIEEFRYREVKLLRGISIEGLLKTVKDGDMAVELRIGTRPNGRVHDHGTAFRLPLGKLDKLFTQEILIKDNWINS